MIEIKYVTCTEENKRYIQDIRSTVFGREQKVDPKINFDGQDPKAIHVLIFKDKRPVATGRMLDDGHIGRVAVLKCSRGILLGSKVIIALEKYARRANYPRIYLGAQWYAKAFYTKLGFSSYGSPYVEANIKHISMEKYL